VSIGDKIVDGLPDSAIEYMHEHPGVMYVITVPLLAFCAFNLVHAIRIHMFVQDVVRNRAFDAARAASEGLGG
jgi:hypothetical protein